MFTTLFWLLALGGLGYFLLRHGGGGGCCGKRHSHAERQPIPTSVKKSVDLPASGENGEPIDLVRSKEGQYTLREKEKGEFPLL